MNTVLFILILLMVDSLHFVFARLLLPHISPDASPLYVILMGTIEVAIYGLVTKKIDLKSFRKNWGHLLIIGFLIAASLSINYAAVAFIDPGTASLLTQTGTLWSLILGILWLRDKLSWQQAGGAVIALAGVFIITYRSGDYLQLGSLMVLSSTLMYSLHAAVSKRYGEQMDLMNFFFFRLVSTLGFLILFTVGRQAFIWPSKTAWPILILAGTVDVVISRTLYYFTLRRLKLSMHTIVLTLSPIVTILWALALFNTIPSPRQLIGGVAVIGGVLIVSLNRVKESPAVKMNTQSPN